MLAGTSFKGAVRVASWLALVLGGAFGRNGPADPLVAGGLVAAMIVAATSLAGTVASVWRGPPLIAFAPDEGLACGEEDSEPVRAYAQLRGTIGGAGHVFPWRLALPLAGWAAALVSGIRPLFWPELEPVGDVPSVVAASCAFAAWLFPSRPYWYREVMGGGAIVYPPEAVPALVARERCEAAPALAAIHELGQAAPILRERAPSHPRDPATPGTREIHIDATGHLRAGDPHEAPRRPQRYELRQRVIVEQDGIAHEVATVNVSSGGLAVRWPGELPVVGANVVVRLEAGAAGLDAVVCWERIADDLNRTVGLKLDGDGPARARWQEVVARAAFRTPRA